MSNWKSETPKGPCAIHATGGSVRRSHLPGRVRPQTSADLARGRELRAGSVGRPQARCAPSSYSRIPRILSPSSGPRLRSHPERRFRPWPRTEPPLSLLAPLASSLLSFSLRTCSPKRKGDGEGLGGGRKSLPTAPSKKHNRTAQCRRAEFAPGEQRGALFSAVVSWPFDLSAAGGTLLLTSG